MLEDFLATLSDLFAVMRKPDLARAFKGKSEIDGELIGAIEKFVEGYDGSDVMGEEVQGRVEGESFVEIADELCICIKNIVSIKRERVYESAKGCFAYYLMIKTRNGGEIMEDRVALKSAEERDKLYDNLKSNVERLGVKFV